MFLGRRTVKDGTGQRGGVCRCVCTTWGLDAFWRKIKGWIGLRNELYEDRDGLKATVQNIWHWLWGLGLSFCLELFSFGVLIFDFICFTMYL